MVSKKSALPKSKLSDWLIWQPLKFTGLMIVLYFAVNTLNQIKTYVFGPAYSFWDLLIYILAAVGFILSVRYVMRRPAANELGRRDYIALQTLSDIITIAISAILPIVPVVVPYLMRISPILAMAVAIVVTLVGVFIWGLAVMGLRINYLRARNMGVSKWRAILSLPFSILWMPAYLLPDTSHNTVIDIRSKWYNKIIDWFMARPANTMVAMTLPILSAVISSGKIGLISYAIQLIFFGLWISITGMKKFQKNINGAYANIAVVINIIILVLQFMRMAYLATLAKPF